jgi:hypothetical protein
MCHSFSIAKIAHGYSFASTQRGTPVLALLARCSAKGAKKMLRYVHRTPKSASGWSYPPTENMWTDPAHVNNGAGTDVRFGVISEVRPRNRPPTPHIVGEISHALYVKIGGQSHSVC